MNYQTLQEKAEMWNCSVRRIQQLCKEGAIPGAMKEGRNWIIPENTESPVRGTAKSKAGKTNRLPLPVGISGYIEAVTKYYYVDKTLLIRDFIDALPKVSLFTRPRRFGKTLNMDMLRVFFEKTEQDTSVYFKDKAIWNCGQQYREMQGSYPVIYLSFKDVKYPNWAEALRNLSGILQTEYARHSELMDSVACHAVDKEYYHKIIAGTTDEVDLSNGLGKLSAMLCKHYGTPAVIIIDEYDTPIQQGYTHGYYNEVVSFIRNLFSSGFKDNNNLAYGFLTGILRVAKESIFSGMNNLKVNTLMDDRFSQYFGFTKKEVREMLAYYGQAEKYDEACSWYDGYRFGNSEIFNPWSVINYVDEGCTPKAFWQSTGSNEIIGDIIANAAPEITEKLRLLMQGQDITVSVDTDVIYPEIQDRPNSIFSFLLITGYLKSTEMLLQVDGSFMCKLAIPNKEIALVYAREIISRLPIWGVESTAHEIQQAVFEADIDKLQKSLRKYLLSTISVYDTGSEAFYQGLMIGLCAILNNRYLVRSNRESGTGRYDIQLQPVFKSFPGFIFELKASKNPGEDLDTLAQTALDQIIQKDYSHEMREEGIQSVIFIGIAFRGKDIAVKTMES